MKREVFSTYEVDGEVWGAEFYVIKNSGDYRKDGVDQVFKSKKEADQVASALRFGRAKVSVEKVED